MKKILSTALALILAATMLTACAPADNGNGGDKSITTYTTEGKVTKLVGDPNATGELTVDVLYEYSKEECAVIKKMYNELYPNVKLTIVNDEPFDGDNFVEKVKKLQAEVVSGKGPDVFYTIGDVGDPIKMMKSGAFADLAPYFENDANFNINDFNQGVFYGGQFDGKQYVVPIEYEAPIFLTTQAIIDETGLDLSKCKDYFSTSDELMRILTENKLNCDEEMKCQELEMPFSLLTYGGFPWVDYKNDIANINSPEIEKAYTELKDSWFQYLRNKDNTYGSSGNMCASNLNSKSTNFVEISNRVLKSIIWNCRALTQMGDTPIVFPWRNHTGGITALAFSQFAVRNNSENIQNAYNFIKILISEEFGTRTYNDGDLSALNTIQYSIPVNNNVIDRFFEAFKGKKGDNVPLWNAGELYKLDYVPDELIEQFKEYLSEINYLDFASDVNYKMRDYIWPYLMGEKTYEECIEQAQQHLEIYVSE